MNPIELNFSRKLLLPLCSQGEEVREAIHDDLIGMSYEVVIPCGRSREEAIARFRALEKEMTQGLWSSYAIQLHQAFPPAAKLDPVQPETTLAGDILAGLFHFLTLGIFKSTGCSPKWPEPGGVLEEGKIRWRVDLAGDPAFGEILFIRNVHFTPVFNKQDFQKSLEKIDRIALYQRQIYEVLTKLRPKHLFLEGQAGPFDFSPVSMRLAVLDRIAHTHFTERPNIEDPLVFAFIGAAEIYGLDFNDVFLHATATVEENNLVERKLEELFQKHKSDWKEMGDDIDFKELIFTKREEWATREMLEFLKNNPGEKAVLIYGAGHSFCDDFMAQGFRAQVISLWFEDGKGELPEFDVPEACR